MLKINEEFQSLIPPLTEGELILLTETIIEDGCRDALIVWNGFIVDGHNRYKICQEHDITFNTTEMAFDDVEAVKDWIDKNQLSRRNLSPDAFTLLLGRRYNRMKKQVTNPLGLGGKTDKIDGGQNVHHQKTSEQLAEQHGVNEKTVRRSGKFAEEVEADPELQDAVMHNVPIKQIKKARKKKKMKEIKAGIAEQVKENPYVPLLVKANAIEWLKAQQKCDLLFTDPPYSTDVDDIESFAKSWLTLALSKVKPTGRAYIFIGAYPREIQAYINIVMPAQILVWTYRNTLGPTPKFDYKLNWQAILYYRGKDALELDCPIMLEQFSVQDINAPDGRQYNREHTWQKPDEIAERFIRHSTKPGDLVLDPFTGTGTFLLAAAKMGRQSAGCENDDEMIKIAEERGLKCQ